MSVSAAEVHAACPGFALFREWKWFSVFYFCSDCGQGFTKSRIDESNHFCILGLSVHIIIHLREVRRAKRRRRAAGLAEAQPLTA